MTMYRTCNTCASRKCSWGSAKVSKMDAKPQPAKQSRSSSMMPIPTNLITGFLGSGKTTAINRLLEHRPDGERWSIFVNEYGIVTVDELLIDSECPEVNVQEVGGGCLCCTVAFAFDAVFSQFIRRSKPDRLLLEPSDAGHPRCVSVPGGTQPRWIGACRFCGFAKELQVDMLSVGCRILVRFYSFRSPL